ncbi:MAG: sporulation protein [Oscillospiraceae bacterium]|jgi:sporulation integral membrane protein YlbJ|nr:sporulation protein [Oscillospiraceae bacterium]
MTRILKKQWLTDLLAGLMLALAALGLLIAPRTTSEAAREGLYICIDVLIPSLFPFFVLSTLTIELGLARIIGRALEPATRPLFRVGGPCAAAVALGFLGGYPVGAKCAISLYEKGQCSKEEAERLLSFCNNSGPAFILGAAGVGILGSTRAGWLLYLTHTAASLTVGLLFRFYGKNSPSGKEAAAEREREEVPRLSAAFIKSVKSSFASVFYISSFVIFFTAAIRLLYTSGVLPMAADALSGLFAPLGMTKEAAQNLLTGLIEITSGLFSLQGGATARLAGKMAMAAFMLGWAGLSVHCQVLSFIGQSGLSPRTYIAGKLLHGLISAVYAFLLTGLTGLELPVVETIAEQVENIARLRFWDTLNITLTAVAAAALMLLLIAAGTLWRRSKNTPG